MKLILVAITIALLGGCLNALPTEGHLRVSRSTEAKAGTTVTIEKAAQTKETKDTAATEAKTAAATEAKTAAATEAKTTVESKEPITVEKALNLVKTTVQKLEADNSAGETQQVSATKTETAKQQQQQQQQTEKQEEKKVESISSSVSAISAPQAPVVGRIETNDEATFSTYTQKYVNPYGDILNRINHDRVRQLAAESSATSSGRRDFFERPWSSYERDNRANRFNRPQTRTLSSQLGSMMPKFGQANSKSQSSVFINGQRVEGDGANSLAPGKKLTPLTRYSANPYGVEAANLLSRQKGPSRIHQATRPLSAHNNVRMLNFQPPHQPRYF